MKSFRFQLPAWLRPVRLVLAACVCALLVFTYVTPAYSAPSAPTSNPKDGEANLLDIERKSQEAVLKDPYSLKQTQTEANKGLNEIQGDSDMNNMKRPENTRGVESIEQKVQESLEKVTGK